MVELTQQQLRSLTPIQRQQLEADEDIGFEPTEEMMEEEVAPVVQPTEPVAPTISAEQVQQQKTWEGVQIMLSRGKAKTGFGQKAVDIYDAIREPGLQGINALRGQLSSTEIQAVEKLHHDYRSTIAARGEYRIAQRELVASQVEVPTQKVYGPQQPEDVFRPTTTEREAFEKMGITLKPGVVLRSEEIGRYEDLGYSSKEAGFLATESVARGGQTFVPQEARDIIRAGKIEGGIIGITGAAIGTLRESISDVPLTQAPPYQKGTLTDLAPTREYVFAEPGKQFDEVPIDVRTGKPFGTIEVAPTTWEVYKESVSEAGPITGTLSFLGGKVERVVTEVALGRAGMYRDIPLVGMQAPYKAQPLGALGREIIEIGPYFTPAGSSLLIASGAESLIFPKGREQIQITKEKLTPGGVGFPSIFAYAPPVAKIGLGAFGLKGQVGKVKAKIELKRFEKVPLKVEGRRIEVSQKSGVDILTGRKKIGKTIYDVRIQQPWYVSPSGKSFTLEEGQMLATKIRKGKFSTQLFEVTGKGKFPTGKVTAVYTPKGYILKSDIPGVRLGIGEVKLKGMAQAKGKIDMGYDFFKQEFTGKLKAKKIMPFSDVDTSRFVSIGKGKKIILTVGGRPEKLYYSALGDFSKVRVKPLSIGRIKIVKPGELGYTPIDKALKISKISTGPGGAKQITKLEDTFALKDVAEKGLKSVFKAPPTPKLTPLTGAVISVQKPGEGLPFMVGGTGLKEIPFAGTQRYEITEMVGRARELPGIISPVKQISFAKPMTFVKPRVEVISALKPMVQVKEKAISKLSSSSQSAFKSIQRSGARTAQSIKVIQRQRFKQLQKQRQQQITTQVTPQAISMKVPIPIPIPLLLKPKEPKRKKKGIPGMPLVMPFTRRYGKWVPILPKPVVKKKAIEAGIARVKMTLAASLQLRKPSGEVVPFEIEAPFTKTFRKAKRDPFTIVQRAPRRLEAIGERREIVLARGGIKYFR